MAQEKSTTPEKQLLRLIEGDSHKPDGMDTHAYVAKKRSASAFSLNAWLGRISFFKGSIKKKADGAAAYQLNVRLINKGLTFCALALFVFTVGYVYTSLSKLKHIPEMILEVQKQAALDDVYDTSILKASSYYLEKVRNRNIFVMGKDQEQLKQEAAEAEDAGPPAEEVTAISQRFRLVGISWSGDPDAMIEDMTTQKTLFVKRGQMVEDIKVQAIFKDKVILIYQGEEIEIR
ncbi:MAG: hypothetical protein V2A72_05340 [Candidatus Omnitrophota bacterium]